MSVLQQLVIWIAALIAGYGSFAAILALFIIFKRRNELYGAKYKDFLRQKDRVESRIKRDKENGE